MFLVEVRDWVGVEVGSRIFLRKSSIIGRVLLVEIWLGGLVDGILWSPLFRQLRLHCWMFGADVRPGLASNFPYLHLGHLSIAADRLPVEVENLSWAVGSDANRRVEAGGVRIPRRYNTRRSSSLHAHVWLQRPPFNDPRYRLHHRCRLVGRAVNSRLGR